MNFFAKLRKFGEDLKEIQLDDLPLFEDFVLSVQAPVDVHRFFVDPAHVSEALQSFGGEPFVLLVIEHREKIVAKGVIDLSSDVDDQTPEENGLMLVSAHRNHIILLFRRLGPVPTSVAMSPQTPNIV